MKLKSQVNRLDSWGFFQSLSPDSPATENLDLLHPGSSEAMKRFLHKGHICFPAIKQFPCLSSLVEGYIDPSIMYSKKLHCMHVSFPLSSGLEWQLLYVWSKLVFSSLAPCFGTGKWIPYIVSPGSEFILAAKAVGMLLSKTYLVTDQIEFEENTATA